MTSSVSPPRENAKITHRREQDDGSQDHGAVAVLSLTRVEKHRRRAGARQEMGHATSDAARGAGPGDHDDSLAGLDGLNGLMEQSVVELPAQGG